MDTFFVILGPVIVVAIPLTVMLCRGRGAASVVAAFVLLAFAFFCAFGFLASLEPASASRRPWLVSYAVVAVASLIGAFRLFTHRICSQNPE